jgi:hypothetical protein
MVNWQAFEPKILHLSHLFEGNSNRLNMHLESSDRTVNFAHAVKSNRRKCVGNSKDTCTQSK